MPVAVAVTRKELTPAQPRLAADASKQPARVRRLLAIAPVSEGVPRRRAAEQGGMDRRTLRDWVHRHDEAGVTGLRSRPCPGRASLLTPERKAELKALVVAGPDPTRSGIGWCGGARWRCVGLRAAIARRFGVEVHQSAVGGWLHRLGLTRLQPRPCHPKKDLAAQEAYEKTLGRQSWLAGFLLQFGEVGFGVAPEAGAQGSRQAPRLQPAAEISPALPVDATELTGGGRVQPRGRRCDHPDLAAQHGGR